MYLLPRALSLLSRRTLAALPLKNQFEPEFEFGFGGGTTDQKHIDWNSVHIGGDECSPYCYKPLPRKKLLADDVDISSAECQQMFREFMSNFCVATEHIAHICALTENQSTSEHWRHIRCGRLTASVFGDIACRKARTAPDNLVRVLMYDKPFVSKYCSFGLDSEEFASQLYKNFCLKSRQQKIRLERLGLVLSRMPGEGFLGASPDYISVCSVTGQRKIVEIKSFFPTENVKNLAELCKYRKKNGGSFPCVLDSNGQFKLNKTHAFYYQMMGQMAILGIHQAELVMFYRDTMAKPNIGEIHCVSLEFDENVWFEMLVKLKNFFVHGIVAEMFTQRIKRNKPLYRSWPLVTST